MSQNGGEDPREAERLLFEQIMIRGHACAAQQLDINLNTQAFSLHGLQTTKAVLPLLVEEENKRNEHGPDAREVSMFDGTRITGPAETQLGHAAHATISHFHSHHAGKGSTRSRSPDSASQFKFSYEESQDVLKKFKDFHNRNLGFVKAKEELFKEIDTAFQTSSKPSVATIFRACMARAFVIELLIKGRWEHGERILGHNLVIANVRSRKRECACCGAENARNSGICQKSVVAGAPRFGRNYRANYANRRGFPLCRPCTWISQTCNCKGKILEQLRDR